MEWRKPACVEGQGLQLYACCKSNAKPKLHVACNSNLCPVLHRLQVITAYWSHYADGARVPLFKSRSGRSLYSDLQNLFPKTRNIILLCGAEHILIYWNVYPYINNTCLPSPVFVLLSWSCFTYSVFDEELSFWQAWFCILLLTYQDQYCRSHWQAHCQDFISGARDVKASRVWMWQRASPPHKF